MQICTEPFLVSWGASMKLQGRADHDQSSGCSCPSVDLPLLPVTKPAPPPLQRYHSKCDPSRAPPIEHNDRIPTLETGPKPTHLSVCRGYLPGRGQLVRAEGIPHFELESSARKCTRWTGDVWNNGMLYLP